MRYDRFSNPIYNEHDLYRLLYSGFNSDEPVFAESSEEISRFIQESNLTLIDDISNIEISVEDYDRSNQEIWNIPAPYDSIEIRDFCLEKCNNQQQINRVNNEMDEFEKRNHTKLLQWLKYFVDVCYEEKIVWGVGRGSSVASYVLYLIGVHKIDSVKYDIDYREFFKGD